jgi:hypothetical protein
VGADGKLLVRLVLRLGRVLRVRLVLELVLPVVALPMLLVRTGCVGGTGNDEYRERTEGIRAARARADAA